MVDMNHETIVTVSLALAVCAGWFGLGAWIGVRFGRQAAEPSEARAAREVLTKVIYRAGEAAAAREAAATREVHL